MNNESYDIENIGQLKNLIQNLSDDTLFEVFSTDLDSFVAFSVVIGKMSKDQVKESLIIMC